MISNNLPLCKGYDQAIELELVKLHLDSLGYASDDIANMLNEGGLDMLKKVAKSALKKSIPAVAFGAATLGGMGKAQAEMPFGWKAGSGQPTATVAGMLGGALTGQQFAKTISRGTDAGKIGAGAGLVAGGALANYLSGSRAKQQPSSGSGGTGSQTGSQTGSGTGSQTGSAKQQGSSLRNDGETLRATEKDAEDAMQGGMEISAQKTSETPFATEDEDGMIKSPFSDFVFKKSATMQSGQTVWDPFFGKSFKIP